MRVLLDQSDCQIPADTVGQAIDAASLLARQRGRLVVEVLVDGKSWTPQEFDDQSARHASALEVRLNTAEPAPLIAQTFADASHALQEADQWQHQAAQNLQAGKTREAMNHLMEAFGIWSSVQKAVEMGTQLANLPIETVKVRGVAGQPVQLDKVIGDLHGHLQAVRNSLQSGDTVALADILLYDLPAVVHHWRGVLDELQALVRASITPPKPAPQPGERHC